jgi:hypothetical protein
VRSISTTSLATSPPPPSASPPAGFGLFSPHPPIASGEADLMPVASTSLPNALESWEQLRDKLRGKSTCLTVNWLPCSKQKPTGNMLTDHIVFALLLCCAVALLCVAVQVVVWQCFWIMMGR